MIKELIHYLFRRHKPGGLVFENIGDGVSPKFRDYRKEHAEELFGAVLPPTLGRVDKIVMLQEYPDGCFCFQNSILSCVSCAIVEYKNWTHNFQKFFAWRDLYARVPHYQGGTMFKHQMNAAKEGICLDNLLPQSDYWGGEARMQTFWKWTGLEWRRLTDDEIANLVIERSKFKIDGGWSYVYAKDKTAIKHAVTKAPCPTGIYIQSGNWPSEGIIKPKYNEDGRFYGDFGHLVTIFDWNDQLKFWWISDHDGNGFKKLSYDYPLAFVASVDDIPDLESESKYMRVVKKDNDPQYFAVGDDNTKAHISSWNLYQYGITKGYWTTKVEVLKQEDFDRIPTDPSMERLHNIMDEFVKEVKA